MRKKKRQVKKQPNHAASSQSPSPPILPSVEGHKDGEGSNDERSSHKKDDRKENPTHWTNYAQAICAAALVVITWFYTYYAGRQVEFSRQQVNLIRDQFTKDQRPYVWVTHPSLDPLEAGGHIHGRIGLTNVGKAPANDVRVMIQAFPPNSDKMINVMFEGVDKFKFQFVGDPAPVLLPYVSSNPETGMMSEKVDSVGLVTTTLIGVEIAGTIWYEDSSRNSYKTYFCMVQYAENAWAFCAAHNEIH